MMRDALLRSVLLLFSLLLAGCAQGRSAENMPAPRDAYVVLVSFDGFRHDYLDRGLTPTLDSLADAGIRARGLIPSQPTKTFPNHYSIATGLYPGEHGIVANTFFDPARDAWYSPADRTTVEDGTWYRGEPIWVTAQKQGLRTGTMFWVGSEADVRGVRPTYWKPFDDAMPAEARVDTVLSWLGLPDEARPRLLTLYFELTDDAGSRHGPTSPEANAAIARADSMIARLIDGARDLPFADRINYVIVSDHGMADARDAVVLDEYIDLDQVIDPDQHIDTTGMRLVTHGPFAFFYLDGDSARIQAARASLQRMPHVRVYERSELPADWHWNDPRVGDLVLVADPYWQIGRSRAAVQSRGAHGWPPEMAPEMNGIFVAAGPGVRRAGMVPAFRNVHVYPLLASLLGVEPAVGISGDAAVLQAFLRGP